jgi:hypothetical protein
MKNNIYKYRHDDNKIFLPNNTCIGETKHNIPQSFQTFTYVHSKFYNELPILVFRNLNFETFETISTFCFSTYRVGNE